MRTLVAKREAIFAAQRNLDDRSSPSLFPDCLLAMLTPGLLAAERRFKSERILADYLKTLSRNNPTFAHYERYCGFCLSNSIPSFPLTTALIALALYHKSSVQGGTCHAYKEDIVRIQRNTKEAWEDYPRYKALEGWAGLQEALQEFSEERKRYGQGAKAEEKGNCKYWVYASESEPEEEVLDKQGVVGKAISGRLQGASRFSLLLHRQCSPVAVTRRRQTTAIKLS
jgi:hypothetical protein